MEGLVQQIVNGVSLGSIYALIALGYTMVYGIINLINFAHGDVYMVGAYIGFYVTSRMGLGFIPSLIISMVVCALLGVLIEKVAYKPIRKSSRIAALTTAIAVSLLLEYGMMALAGSERRTFRDDLLPDHSISLFNGNVIIDGKNIYIVLITIILMVLLQFIVHRTKVGKSMRAVSQDKEAAELMGINSNRTISFTFAIGSALAGAAGVLVGIYYNSIDPFMGMMPGLKAFIAAVIGGIGIIPGAVFGGFFLGIIETFVSYAGASTYKDAVAFIILIVMLIIKPSGLLGKNVKEKV